MKIQFDSSVSRKIPATFVRLLSFSLRMIGMDFDKKRGWAMPNPLWFEGNNPFLLW
jgi:hypothetical protein